MDQILKYLSLKYFGDWMATYDSLQRRERVTADDIEKVCSKVEYNFVTLIDEDYPNNFKTIYKPLFNLFYDNGNYELTKAENIVTVFADPVKNKDEILELADKGIVTVWYNLSKKQYADIVALKPENNIFVVSEMKSNFIPATSKNLVVSEIYEKNPSRDYSSQAEERVYMGLSKKILILNELGNKQELNVYSYICTEDIKVFAKAELITAKADVKLFKNAKSMAEMLQLANNSIGKELA